MWYRLRKSQREAESPAGMDRGARPVWMSVQESCALISRGPRRLGMTDAVAGAVGGPGEDLAGWGALEN